MQICAKLGGEPWAMDKMPFTKVPTMVIGLDISNKGSNIIISICASYNNTFTKFISVVASEINSINIGSKITECVKLALENVK
jgi:hypothetical protein